MRPLPALVFAAFLSTCGIGAHGTAWAASVDDEVHVVPRPANVELRGACRLRRLHGLSVSGGVDAGSRAVVDERWRALGIPPLRAVAGRADVTVRIAPGPPQSYRLAVDASGVRIDAADADGAFYAFATLAQLGVRDTEGLAIPCVRITDGPSLRWRILSDDVSRGPLPTMRYFRERIRTIAAFKMNGYSPYMEHVFLDSKHPLAAPARGITADELRALDAYARSFHVALIPEQQTFAHMHGTLQWERFAPLAELPHGYLISPANPAGHAYVAGLIADELAAVPHPPFFHIGSDEPLDLGRGASTALVAAQGRANVYAAHVLETIALLRPSGARPMIWDDAVQAAPELLSRFPKPLVFINWHYGAEPTFRPYIERIARAGFDQMVAPGADNWNEIFPHIDVALSNIERFVGEGKAAHVLGLFQTVWHDDGETLYEATWYPLLFAAAGAWEQSPLDRARYARDFPRAFFGVDDHRYADDLAALARARKLLDAAGASSNYLFWADAFDPALRERMKHVDVVALRLAAETVIEHRRETALPPLHANAAEVMEFAARRYDALARNAQIADEARTYYDDARSNVGKNDDYVGRGLNVAKYLFWESRDTVLGLEPRARRTWEYESGSEHEESVLERYHAAAQRAIARADALNRTAVEVYPATRALPSFDDVIRR